MDKKPFKCGEKDYIFKGLITCGATGRIATAETKKKTYTNGQIEEWTYLRTWDPDNHNKRVYVKEEKIIQEVEKVFASMYLEPELLKQVISYIKSSAVGEQDYYKERMSELQTEHTKMKNRLDRLTDLFLDGDLTKEAYEEKRQQLLQKREDIVKEIENYNNADSNHYETLVRVVELASGALETFRGSTIEEKRKLIKLVFANLELKAGKLVYTLRPPFDGFVKCTNIEEWRTREESNL